VKSALAVATLAIGSFSPGLTEALGLAAIFSLVARLSHFWAGLAALLVAASSPCFYLGGPNGAFAPAAIAVAGLGIAALGSGSRGRRRSATALGVVGLGLGWRANGALFGVALPGTSVALAWILALRDREGRAPACVAGAAGAVALILEALVAFGVCRAPGVAADALRGVALNATPGSFDFPIGELGRAFFPWSALVPLSLAGLTELPVSHSAPAAELERQSALRVLLLTGAVLSYGLSGLPASDSRRVACGSLPFIAGAVGLWLCDIGRGRRLSRTAILALALLVVLCSGALVLRWYHQPVSTAGLALGVS
jgi:hypothetical protein